MSDAAEKSPKIGPKGQAVRDRLAARTAKSAALHDSAGERLALEVVATVDMPHPIYIERAEGARMVDVDGNSYIDMTMGFGPHVMGHRPPPVEAALQAQLQRGWHFGIHNGLQAELAGLIIEASPAADHVVFANSGTEATMYAMRAARAFSGKSKVALFDGAYHGAHDYALVKADMKSPRNRPQAKVLGLGVPDAIANDTMMVLPYRDAATFDLIREYKQELALVMVEPVQSSNPRLDCGDFLQELAAVCRESEVLFLLDEVITGFRLDYGGGQAYFDVTPDLATYGKAIGGGLPIGAVAGRGDVMAMFAGHGYSGGIFSGGTFSGNPLTMAAGTAMVTHLKEKSGELYPHLMREGKRLAGAINGYCHAENMAAQMLHAGSMFHLRFQEGRIESARDITTDNAAAEREFYLHLLNYGVIVPGIHLCFISGAHGSDDVDRIIGAFKQAFAAVREDGLL